MGLKSWPYLGEAGYILCFCNRRGKVFSDEYLKFIPMCLFEVESMVRILELPMGLSERERETSMGMWSEVRQGRVKRYSHVETR